MAAFVSFLRAFLLSALLFPVALATHEVMHLVVYSALGVPAALVVTSWHLGVPGLARVAICSSPAWSWRTR